MRQRQIVIPALMAPVSIEQRTLPPPFQQGVACDQAIILEDPDLVGEAGRSVRTTSRTVL